MELVKLVLHRLFLLPQMLWFSMWNFFFAWLHTRNWRRLRLSWPAAIVLAAVGGVLLVSTWQRRNLGDDYNRLAGEALAAGEIHAANLFVRRASALGTDQPATKMAIAEARFQENDDVTGQKLMSELAPADRVGYGPAHRYLARRMLDESESPDQAKLKTVRHHLEAVLERNPADAEARVWLGKTLLAVGELKRAEQEFITALPRYPNLALEITSIYMFRNNLLQQRALAGLRVDQEEIKRNQNAISRYAALAVDHYRAAAESEPSVADNWIGWAIAETRLENYTSADRILRRGRSETSDPRFNSQIASLYVTWSRHLAADQPERSLILLAQAVEVDPNHVVAVQTLTKVAGRSDVIGQEARKSIHQQVRDGKLLVSGRIALGTYAATQGEISQAIGHLSAAHELNRRGLQLCNNYAWALARDEPPQLERALQVINPAISDWPQHPKAPEARETRGQILLRLKRYEEAAVDLEFALRYLSDRPDIHNSLAEIYEALNNPSIAAKHRALAAKIAQKRQE